MVEYTDAEKYRLPNFLSRCGRPGRRSGGKLRGRIKQKLG